MEKEQIVSIASSMTTRKEFLALLNHIKRDELATLGYDMEKFYPFTMKILLYYCNPNHADYRYRRFQIKKKSGGYRQITAPRSQHYLMLLQAVNVILKAFYTPSDFAMGFTEGRSIVTNAKVHYSQNYVFNTDLKDFFPSIEQARVWKRLQLKPFCFPKEIASLIAGLCAMKEQRVDDSGMEICKYILPQGAPTSPIITNMICDTLDRRLNGLAKRFGLRYTRYADDITFSSMHNVYAEDGVFRKELTRIITDQGFTINDSKTRLQKRGTRQEVTGLVVCEKVNVSREYVRDLRNLLYIWDKYGYVSAQARFLPKYRANKGHVKKGTPNMRNVLEGKMLYLKMVKGEADSVYQKLNAHLTKLIQRDFSDTSLPPSLTPSMPPPVNIEDLNKNLDALLGTAWKKI